MIFLLLHLSTIIIDVLIQILIHTAFQLEGNKQDYKEYPKNTCWIQSKIEREGSDIWAEVK